MRGFMGTRAVPAMGAGIPPVEHVPPHALSPLCYKRSQGYGVIRLFMHDTVLYACSMNEK